MTLALNMADHPNVRFVVNGEDGLVHVGGIFGDTWCAEDLETPEDFADTFVDDGSPQDHEMTNDPTHWGWCEVCLASAKDDDLVVET